MPRYILIDNCSGFIWGDSETIEHESPEAYAAALDALSGEPGRCYERVASLASNETGYHAHEAPADFPTIEDGQDQPTIDRVGRLPRVAILRATDNDEEA